MLPTFWIWKAADALAEFAMRMHAALRKNPEKRSGVRFDVLGAGAAKS